jgi:hypothetical protein
MPEIQTVHLRTGLCQIAFGDPISRWAPRVRQTVRLGGSALCWCEGDFAPVIGHSCGRPSLETYQLFGANKDRTIAPKSSATIICSPDWQGPSGAWERHS